MAARVPLKTYLRYMLSALYQRRLVGSMNKYWLKAGGTEQVVLSTLERVHTFMLDCPSALYPDQYLGLVYLAWTDGPAMIGSVQWPAR